MPTPQMHVQQSLSMMSLHEIASVLQSRMTELNGVTGSYSWVTKLISWFFVTLGLSFFLPIAVLIVFDFFLWIWRLVSPTNAPRTARQRRESLSHPVSTS